MFYPLFQQILCTFCILSSMCMGYVFLYMYPSKELLYTVVHITFIPQYKQCTLYKSSSCCSSSNSSIGSSSNNIEYAEVFHGKFQMTSAQIFCVGRNTFKHSPSHTHSFKSCKMSAGHKQNQVQYISATDIQQLFSSAVHVCVFLNLFVLCERLKT